MKDKVFYEVPYGVFGELFDFLFLKNHMINFILERNKVLKAFSESKQLQPVHNRDVYSQKNNIISEIP